MAALGGECLVVSPLGAYEAGLQVLTFEAAAGV